MRYSFFLWIWCLIWVGLPNRQAAAELPPIRHELTFHLLLSESKCQVAIWISDERGAFADTVYVTKKVAQKGLGNRSGQLDDKWGGPRLSVLPVWAHHRGIDYGDGNPYPPKEKPLVDAVTSATPDAGELIWTWRPEKPLKAGKYDYYIEVNKSFDKNPYHDYSWYRGQPSVVWKGSVLIGEKPFESEAAVVGHGHVSGADGIIDPDLSTLTTALKLIKKAKVIFRVVQ